MQPATEQTHNRFPDVSGHNINGKGFTLPGDLAGRYNIVLMAFTQRQQYSVDTWIPALRQLEASQDDVRVYELPTLAEFSWWRRRQIDFWMSTGISDPVARATTITLYTDLNALLQQLGIPDTHMIQLLVMDRQGEIYWRDRGPCEDDRYASLVDALMRLLRV